MNNDNGFARAQAQYDAQMPPEDPEVEDCPECDGEGACHISNCCGATIFEPDICSECKEHCDEEVCGTCDGKGEVPIPSKREIADEKAERKAEEYRDEPRDRFFDEGKGRE